jgi:hypothetical protein
MNSANNAVRPVRREVEERRDPLDIFREFLSHLGRAARRRREASSKPIGCRGR